MTIPQSFPTRTQSRRALLAKLREAARTMLEELAQVVGVTPAGRLYEEPSGTLAILGDFCRRTDFGMATQYGRTWMLNRLGLFVTRYFVVRYGGALELQEDPTRPFYLHFVVAGMDSPVAPDARLDPFAIAHEVLGAHPKPDIAELIHQAERSLLAPGAGE